MAYVYYFLTIVFMGVFCHCQTSITEPKLISVRPINSTALTVIWQFANVSIDQSDLIKIYIIFYEYYYGYNQTYASTNYTFTSTNKTITNLTKNFDFVNAYYYVCFSSNSTITNLSISLPIDNQCILTRTCLRSNTACPGPSSVIILPTTISSNSFIISFLWPNDLPYSSTLFSAQLISNGQNGTPLSVAQNNSYTNRPYQFTGLQPKTSYTVNTSFTYTLLNSITTNVTTLTVTTSCSFKLISSKYLLVFFSVILYRIMF